MRYNISITLILLALAAGFFIGRATVGKDDTVQWRQAERVVEAVPVPEVKWFEIPKVYYLPSRPDTIIHNSVETVIQAVDTAKIISEYVRINRYDFSLFENKHGRLDIQQSLQYNKIMDIKYSYTPNYMEVTRTKSAAFTPFVGVAYNSTGIAGLGGGAYIMNIGIEYQYFTNNTHEVGVKYIFK